jgi:hypothetical protein
MIIATSAIIIFQIILSLFLSGGFFIYSGELPIIQEGQNNDERSL